MKNSKGNVLTETLLWLGLISIFLTGLFELIRAGRTRLEELQKERMAYDGYR